MEKCTQLQIVYRSVAELRPSPRNPRQHSDAQIAKLRRSIEVFGFVVPVLINRSGELITGEARWRGAAAAGLTTIPCILLDHLTPAGITAYRVADNRLALEATWNEPLLADVLREVQLVGKVPLPDLGFNETELHALLDPLTPADERVDQVPALPATPVTALGDVWQLGQHRLVCGDSTHEETLARLFDSQAPTASAVTSATAILTDPPYGMAYDGGRARAAAVVTDPPYGMALGKGKEAGSTPKGATVKAHGMILNDDLQGTALVDLVAGALSAGLRFAAAEAALYVCFTWRTWREFQLAIERAGRKVSACIVWDKGSIGLGFQHYRPQHEFIFYSAGARWFGGNTEGDVWTLSRGSTAAYVHPTQKPVELLERAIRNSTRQGDVVLDLFGGSGSTLIACERLGRAARLVELDPKYCDSIVQRWESLAGRKAIRTPGDGIATI